MASVNTIICDLVDYYKDRGAWEAELDAKIEKFVNLVDGEEIVYSSINGQQFRWAEGRAPAFRLVLDLQTSQRGSRSNHHAARRP